MLGTDCISELPLSTLQDSGGGGITALAAFCPSLRRTYALTIPTWVAVAALVAPARQARASAGLAIPAASAPARAAASPAISLPSPVPARTQSRATSWPSNESLTAAPSRVPGVALTRAASPVLTPAAPLAASSARVLPCAFSLTLPSSVFCRSAATTYACTLLAEAQLVPAGSYAASQARAWAAGAANLTCVPSRTPSRATATGASSLITPTAPPVGSQARARAAAPLLAPTPSAAPSRRAAWPSSEGFSIATVHAPARMGTWAAVAVVEGTAVPAGSYAASRARAWAAARADLTVTPSRVPSRAALYQPAGFLTVGVPRARQAAAAWSARAALDAFPLTAPTRAYVRAVGAANLTVAVIRVGGQSVAYTASAAPLATVLVPFASRTPIAYADAGALIFFTGSGPVIATVDDLYALAATVTAPLSLTATVSEELSLIALITEE